MTLQPQTPAPLSKASLTSFICGLLAWLPVVGLVAIIAGIIGFFKGSKMRGRWMAVVGALLGLAGSVGWGIVLVITIWAASQLAAYTANEKVAAHDFIKALADNDIVAMKNNSIQVTDDQLAELTVQVKAYGAFVDTTFTAANWNEGGSGSVEGFAEFKSGKHHFTASMSSGNTWKVTNIGIDP